MSDVKRIVAKALIGGIDWSSQIRRERSEEDVDVIATSMKKDGQQYPVILQRVGDKMIGIDGQTRCLAATKIGWTKILAIVEEVETPEEDRLLRALICNLARTDLKPLEQAREIKRLMGLKQWSLTEAASRVGKTIGALTKVLAVLDLPDEIVAQVDAGTIGVSVGYELSKVADPQIQAELAAAAASGQVTRDEVAAEVVSQKKGRKKRRRKAEAKAEIALVSGYRIEVRGRELSIDSLALCFEEALEHVRRVQASGGDIDQLKRLCRNEAKVTTTA